MDGAELPQTRNARPGLSGLNAKSPSRDARAKVGRASSAVGGASRGVPKPRNARQRGLDGEAPHLAPQMQDGGALRPMSAIGQSAATHKPQPRSRPPPSRASPTATARAMPP